MKKIVFINAPMTEKLDKFRYPIDGNKSIEYDGEVLFPVNAILAKTLEKNDDVKVVVLSKEDGNSANNVRLFEDELNEINREIGANIEYVVITTPFVETFEVHESLFRSMIEQLEEGAQLIGEITYGPKSLPIIMFAVMNFAEKFFKADIKHVIYGRVDIVNDGSHQNPMIYDMSPLYYLNSLTDFMEFASSKDAVKALDGIITF